MKEVKKMLEKLGVLYMETNKNTLMLSGSGVIRKYSIWSTLAGPTYSYLKDERQLEITPKMIKLEELEQKLYEDRFLEILINGITVIK